MLTDEEMKVCERNARHLDTARRADYCSYPGADNVRAIYDIYAAHTEHPERINVSCGICVLKYFKVVAGLYAESRIERQLVEAGAKKPRKSAKNAK